VTPEGDPTYQITNEQDLDAPSVGEGFWPVGFRANRFVTTDLGQPRRNHGMIGGQWINQHSLLPPSVVHCQALQLPDEDFNILEETLTPLLEHKYTLEAHRAEAKKERNRQWGKLVNKLLEAFISSEDERKRAKRFAQFVSELASTVHYFRGPLLLARMYFRQYILYPTKITLKDIALRILGLPLEMKQDWEEFQEERYILCDYQGKEPDLATDTEELEKKEEEEKKRQEQQLKKRQEQPLGSESEETSAVEGQTKPTTQKSEKEKDEKPPKFTLQFPDKWLEEGIQIKIRSPFRLRPYRSSKEKEMLESWDLHRLCDIYPSLPRSQLLSVDERARNLAQWLEAKATFLTLKGEIEAPGLPPPDILKRPFLRLYVQAFVQLAKLRLRVWAAPILRSPLLQGFPGFRDAFQRRISWALHKVRQYASLFVSQARTRVVQCINWLRGIYEFMKKVYTWLDTVLRPIVPFKRGLHLNTRLVQAPPGEPNALTMPSPSTARPSELAPVILTEKRMKPRGVAHGLSRTWTNIWSQGMTPPAYPRATPVARPLATYLRVRGKLMTLSIA